MTAIPVGYAEGADGTPVEVSRWCPNCREIVVARKYDNACCWCDAPTVPAAEATSQRSEPMEAVSVQTRTCKVEGCDQPALARLGPYAGLCDEHKATAKAVPRNGGSKPGKRVMRAPIPATYAGRAQAVMVAAQRLDEAKREYEDAQERYNRAVADLQHT